MNEIALREEICRIGRLMHERNYIDGSGGNITARLEPGRILATPSGLAKGYMTPDQLIIVDIDGQRIDEPTPENAHLRPTSELRMHLECYRQREDVGGVVHAHPPTAVALTVAGVDFERCVTAESTVVLGLVPTAPYATPAEDWKAVRDLIGDHDALLLSHHGSLTVAKTVWDAYLALEVLEHTAKILYMAEQLGTVRPLSTAQIDKLLEIRERLGLMRRGDPERFREASEKIQA
jgi:L-fuculose-phosphate aldolase